MGLPVTGSSRPEKNKYSAPNSLDLPPAGIFDTEPDLKMETPMIFSVPSMSCGHCTSAIENSIKVKDPSAVVVTDLELHLVSVQSSLELAAVQKAIADAGYDASAV